MNTNRCLAGVRFASRLPFVNGKYDHTWTHGLSRKPYVGVGIAFVHDPDFEAYSAALIKSIQQRAKQVKV